MNDRIQVGIDIGAVSSALLKWVEKEHGVPVINLFCDGLRNPNDNLEPYVFYLRQKEAPSSAMPY
jgi:hypothetical protein